MAGFRWPGSALIAATTVPPRTGASWAATPIAERARMRISPASGGQRRIGIDNLLRRRRGIEAASKCRSALDKKRASRRATTAAAQEVGEDPAQLAAAVAQPILDARGRVRVDVAHDQPGLLEIGEAGGEGRGADVTEAAPQLVEPDR